jgi:hypothetical protein
MKSILFFAISIFVGLFASGLSTDLGRGQVIHKLELLKDDCRILIDGKTVPSSKEVLSVLKTVESLPAHHSHPTKRINIDIFDHAPRLVLSLGRDSDDQREYWVFYPKYFITANSEIGRIKTPLFDAY